MADARLRGHELWRRNGQASLWRPSWWPLDLAPLFWPVLLAVALILLLVLGLQGASGLRRFRAAAGPAPRPVVVVAPDALQPPSAPDRPPAAPLREPSPELPFVASEDASAELVGNLAGEVHAESAAEPQSRDPLAQLVQRPGADGLLVEAAPSADQLTLVLQLAPAFATLPAASQQRYAEQWQLWAADLGYEHLELRDSRAGLLARDALVGAGMIVLNDSSSP